MFVYNLIIYNGQKKSQVSATVEMKIIFVLRKIWKSSKMPGCLSDQ